MRTSVLTCAMALAMGLLTSTARADSYFESGDAGGMPFDAQETSGGDSLDFIHGSINGPLDADAFTFLIEDGSAFSAEVVSVDGIGNPQLFLFDVTGSGFYANNDQAMGNLLPFLPGFAWLPAGHYLLLITEDGLVPETGTFGPVFDPFPPYVLHGAGALAPYDNLTGSGQNSFGYTIRLTGATHANPEPGTMGLLGSAIAGFAAWRRRRNKARQAA